MTHKQIIDEREQLLYRLNQITGALEELTFLKKNKYIELKIYTQRFDKIIYEFNKLKEKFNKLGEKFNEV